jgi:hypothetical protein
MNGRADNSDDISRTAEAYRTREPHLNGAPATARQDCTMQSSRTAEASRSEASLRSEDAYRRWVDVPPSQRPLAQSRAAVASVLDEEMHNAWLSGDDRASNVCVAQALGVDERIVREYRLGKKYLPLGALLALPRWLASRVLLRVQTEMGADRAPLAAMPRVLEALRGSVSKENAAEVRRAVREAQRQLLEIDALLDEASR